jgi:hypothetical protein
LTEIEPVRGLRDLLDFAEHGMTLQPGETKRQRLAMKMATGSGKTMAIACASCGPTSTRFMRRTRR